MKKLSSKILLLAVALLTSSYISALVNVYKFGNTNFSGSITYSTKAFEPYGGTLLVGSDNKGGGDATYALASVTRSDTMTRRTGGAHDEYFTPHATNVLLTGKHIQNVGILHNTDFDTAASHFLAVSETDSANLIAVIPTSNSTTVTPESKSWFFDAVGLRTRGVTHLTTGSSHTFLRVLRWADGDGPLPNLKTPTENDGVAVVRFDSSDAAAGNILHGAGGAPMTKAAVKLDRTSGQLQGQLTSPAVHGLINTFTVNDMTFCTSLETLYVSGTVDLYSHANAGLMAFGVVKGTVEKGPLALSPITTVTPHTGRGSVIGIQSGTPAQKSLSINRVRCMETSTGLMYLIVNGGVDTISGAKAEQRNKVYALRLATGVPLGSLKGQIIQNDILAETKLATAFNYTTSLSAIVGAGNVPWESHITTSDMQVIGDAVYVSGTPGVRNALNDPGVWKSQAMFDHEGKIVAWTPWERVFPSQGNAALNAALDDTPFFAVDARTGHVWRGKHGSTLVTRTMWNRPIETASGNTLIRRLAEQLAEGCYCALDLPKETPGIANNTNKHNSLALFGGFEKVVFARTKQLALNTVTNKTSFANGANFQTTSNGLFGIGPIRCLGFSYNYEKPSDTTKGKTFFFAGTNTGLYAYAQSTGFGFKPTIPGGGNVIGPLNANIFTSGKWWRVADITLTPTTAVSQIVTGTGDRVYFTALDVTSVDHIVDKLYEMPLTEAVSSLSPRVIAESGKEGLPNNAVFSGCAILTTTFVIANNDAEERKMKPFIGVLSTNNGIYTTTCDLRHLHIGANNRGGLRQTSAITDNNFMWEPILTTTNIAHHSIHRLKDRRLNAGGYEFRNTHFWDIPILDDTTNLGIYENSTFLRAGLSNSATTSSIFFNGILASHTNPVSNPVQAKPVNVTEAERIRRFALNEDTTNFNNVDFSVNYYSDGGRRFFVRFNPNEDGVYSSLRTLPFNAARWNMTSPSEAPDDDLSTVKRIFWIENISGTGQLMAGVDDGVLTLD